MTLSVRNSILRLGSIGSLLAFGAFLYGAYRVLETGNLSQLVHAAEQQRWLIFSWNVPADTLAWSMATLGGIGLFVPVTLVLITHFFRKISAPEVFFFLIFLFTLALDLAKLMQPLTAALELPRGYAIAATRVSYFGNILGVFCLFISSLYIAGVTYQKTGTALAIAALVAFSLVYALPVDSLELNPSLVHTIGEEMSIQIVILVIYLLTILNTVYGVLGTQDSEYTVLLVGIVLLAAGRQLLFLLGTPLVCGMGLVATIAGTVVFAGKSRQMYLWL